ncbi:hypothetical protein ACJIZ3_024187 [Penstemon smallii]|uniref:Kinesin-like protein n=1 Tax=Penstemon smallii TaxID=265156 RepID=A0ABD3TSS0_9LAMI
MDNSRTKQQRKGSLCLTPSSMSRTLWSSESPTRDSQSSDDRKGVNVQVVLRCRPLNEDEMKTRTNQVISCDELNQQVTATPNNSNKLMDRTFVFDKVFGPASQQKELYDDVVGPTIYEVLEGYSWTIFAYGQTGTGKTYTMEGEGRKEKNGQFHKNAGVIPRAVQHIFDILESKKADYSVKVTFLELYNEEITDLLASDEKKRPLVLMEDGKGFVFVRGLEEEIVISANEIYTILEKGSSKKHTAETLLNKQSNRSHSIFSITIQIRESSSDGSELIKCGKLNLVDLAGSENILRSGAREIRAREAGEINKSLLTLGRVINALADNSSHVPYRQSKLTRLLRDSLGGNTKTCMIATISPSFLSLEETLGTLDYAFRAKSIKNTPEANRKVMKSALVIELYSQINRLKQELHEARGSNGVYVPRDDYQSEETTKKELMELQELYLYQQQLTVDLKDQLESTKRELTMTGESLLNLENQYQRAKDTVNEKENMISNLLCSGKELTETAIEIRSDLEGAASYISTLFDTIEHKKLLEESNKHHIDNVYSHLALQLQELDKSVSTSVTNQEQQLKLIQDNIQSSFTSKAEAIDELTKQIEKLKELYASGIKHLDDSAEELYENSQLTLRSLSSELSTSSTYIMNLVVKTSSDAETINNGLKSSLNSLGSSITAFLQQEEENRGRTYQTSKSISESLLNFSKNLNVYISKLRLMEEDSQTITNQKLSAFTNKFEEFAVGEERLLLGKIAELLANSTSRKKNLIQAAVDDVLESNCKRTNKINQEISDMQSFNADAEETLKNYVEKTESNYVANTAAIEAGKGTIEDGLQSCITKSTEVAEHSRKAEESLLLILKKNVESFDSFVKDGTIANENIHACFSSMASSILEETSDASKNIAFSLEYPWRIDHEASEKIKFVSTRCFEDMKEMNNIHSQKVDEISKITRKSLLDEYMVDDSSISTQKRRFNLPSKEHINKLINGLFGDSHMQIQPHVVSSKSLEDTD